MQSLREIDTQCDLDEWARKLYLGTVMVSYDELTHSYILRDNKYNQIIVPYDVYLKLCDYYEGR